MELPDDLRTELARVIRANSHPPAASSGRLTVCGGNNTIYFIEHGATLHVHASATASGAKVTLRDSS